MKKHVDNQMLIQLNTQMLNSTLTVDSKVNVLEKMLLEKMGPGQHTAVEMVWKLWKMVQEKQVENYILGSEKDDRMVALEIIYKDYHDKDKIR